MCVQGTFVYMAPEMMFLKPGQDLTTLADVFSYAVTLWEVSSCCPPTFDLQYLQLSAVLPS